MTESKVYFGSLTERMNRYRESVLNKKPYIDAERALLVTETYQKHMDKPANLKRAYMLQNILEKMTIYIEDDSLIAGNQASSNKDAPIFPEYTLDFVLKELDLFEKRDGDVFYITEETKEELRSIAPFWENNTLRARAGVLLPKEVAVYMETGFFGMEGKMNSGDAHLAVNYQKLLEEGLIGFEKRARAAKAALDLTVPENIDKYHFYDSVFIVIAAVKTYAERYAKLARQMAETASADRQKELLEMARICDKVPYQPAETFAEAVQSVWFIQCVLQIESNGHSLSYGRFDQYMYPYAQADIEAGRESQESIIERLTNLWIKTLTINKVRSQSHTFSSAGSPLYQNVTIAGQTIDKKDAVNPMSYWVLTSVAQTKLPQPNLTVRYHAGLDKRFMNECIEVMKLGFGMPAMNNDEVIIPSFINKGVLEEDAYNYSAIGCVETAVPGKWGYRCTGMSYINFPKILLITMNDGIDPSSGKRFAKGHGHFTEMTSYEELKAAWDETLREITRMSVIVENAIDLGLEREVPDILCSALTDDCIGRGKTLKEGGAVYDFISGLQVGIANLSDSLAALKKLVFEEERLTTRELWHALETDFAGEEGEAIRQMLINEAPKYGNDDDYADQLVVDAYDTYIDEIAKYPNTRYGRGPIGGIRYSGTSSISANVGQGKATLATPDGRHAGTPLAEGCSPEHSMDKKGPTSVLKSVSKLRTEEIVGGVLLNQKVNPQTLSKEEDKVKLIALLRTFFNRLHGYHIQYNVVSRETLIAAQENPEDYRDLIVRVAGYSAFFNSLSKATQDDIIERTEHTL
ncbi:formate C-acetyltransferase/glycerol dehydratase family glycyl radical enzyme [Streptococcus iniae]|uniref:glycyl radical protein n=1 Tax=Streptococcus iniae TaxID=1346 RepID=UPI000EF6F717|nr:glycyl radical protein [Streptococcus iniae]RLV04163.1 formate C-acetyltransferase/glycerol dehydratase family glycyl radical enzyme [Streptococcus iniae]RLV08101.1 formate C-acetyltransferase/glycerol dehydratase family glycyl radical enzyme [Streptococcus iniae]RLV20235.1 formate C-acetyltransferase/glycerol dehydratase family glycyl radical enzyme [Streptococcus iniae]RLV25420.1 formate C-acetyltransferase/glycerol dehydratase family glycyl radical enzyme [Streptococcus iniae]RMI55146.1 